MVVVVVVVIVVVITCSTVSDASILQLTTGSTTINYWPWLMDESCLGTGQRTFSDHEDTGHSHDVDFHNHTSMECLLSTKDNLDNISCNKQLKAKISSVSLPMIPLSTSVSTIKQSRNTYNCFMALLDFVRDYPGELTPERKNQENKTNLDLLEQEIVSGSGISWAICKSPPWPRHITMPASHHSSFLQARCPSCCPTTSVKALKAM